LRARGRKREGSGPPLQAEAVGCGRKAAREKKKIFSFSFSNFSKPFSKDF
jgi:hypothetical protein